MESEGSLPHSQVPATCPYPESDQSNPCPLTHFLKIRLNIILPSTPGSSKWLFPSGLLTKPCKAPFLTFAYLLTYLLIPCSRLFLEKLTGSQLVKKFPAFYETRRFIAAFTTARHLSLSWASSSQSIPPHPTSWRSILILSSLLSLGFPSGLFPSGFPPKPGNYLPVDTKDLEWLKFCKFCHLLLLSLQDKKII